jgi:hypothetical protein
MWLLRLSGRSRFFLCAECIDVKITVRNLFLNIQTYR